MPFMNQENSREILANEKYPVLFACRQNEEMVISTEALEEETMLFQIPNITAERFGDSGFKKEYGLKYALYGGAMANGIASSDMVIALGKAGFMGSYGAGGMFLEVIAAEIDKIQAALGDKPYMINMLSNRNGEAELKLAQLLIDKKVPAVEASAYIVPSDALIYYRVKGIYEDAEGNIVTPHKVIAKVSREEVLEKFVLPPDAAAVARLVAAGLLTEAEAALASRIPMADDITVEADSGGHTDGRPLVSMLPALIALAERIQAPLGYQKKVRVGAGGGIGTGLSCLAAFQMGAAYVVTGSVNQSCVEAGTSDYVKKVLAETAMADVMMAPCADMFESGARVEVIKKGTMYPQNAQKLYEYYTKYPSFEAIPQADRDRVEKRILRDTFANVWNATKDYFAKVDPAKIAKAEADPKLKMALVFRWYLGCSSRWAVKGEQARQLDMQIWCGQSMGAFNLWVKGTPLEKMENRKVAVVAETLLQSCAYEYMKNMIQMFDFTNLKN
ncbi:MAG: PfaD family polyunsaturated fatty acid/polyketide biosynthesis protein [Lachnospiraceae bacterium]|nr:PfaD family polyunsaturated fatty acid/polyketide biosynthesis protein [Lachnospiraceae bacterium]